MPNCSKPFLKRHRCNAGSACRVKSPGASLRSPEKSSQCATLSGDFFKVMKFRSALGLALGDIVGKGLTAGIWQTHVMGLLHRAAHRNVNPGRALAEVNRNLCRDEEQPPLAALFFARINARTNELTYCNAGLPAPLLLRDNGTLERLDEGGPILGAVAEGIYRTGRVTLNPGDMLVGHSDGVS